MAANVKEEVRKCAGMSSIPKRYPTGVSAMDFKRSRPKSRLYCLLYLGSNM
jgi:hypothetical protein